MSNKKENTTETGLEIAVIGMAGRFPGAKNIEEFWNNLKNGVESIHFFSDEELENFGVSTELLKNPNRVKASTNLENKEYFDASFFGYNPREAELMDPQQRLFHEVCWQALENSGYDPFSYKGLIGLYAGSANSFLWEALTVLSGKTNDLGDFEAGLLSYGGMLSTRVSHKLDLKGPSLTVFTTCSTSLVAIHLACRAIITGECDMALAGGVSVSAGENSGYMYQEGMVFSPDGHCRAFDARAKGTNFGEGIGLVVLKQFKDAFACGDHIYALVKGSAINNDGMGKVSYAAPGKKGQQNVIRTALNIAQVAPESIGFIETHGTGTFLGDTIEIEALKHAFKTDKKGFCRIGAVKTNIGHLDTAAGVVGFIKAVLALKHKLIPPTLNFETPNPNIDFKNSPFYVNTQLCQWKNDKYPLRAGVSSFGIGGTNAHVVLEEFSPGTRGLAPWPDAHPSRKYQLFLLSARTQSALDRITDNLLTHLKKYPDLNLANMAYTLQVGRRPFQYRKMMVCSDVNELIDTLSSANSTKIKTFSANIQERTVIFMFPGQGAQYVNMGLDLYETEPEFRKEMDHCFEILKTLVNGDIKEILYPGNSVSPLARTNPERFIQTHISQPLLFAFEYALAKLLIKWGITPDAMIGYSFGEYAAACLSGVFSLEEALKLMVARGELIREIPAGLMLSVPLRESEIKPLINSELSIAIDNGPSCIVAGSTEAIAAFGKKMKQKRLLCMHLEASHAIHSSMMDPILKEFEKTVAQFDLKKPVIPYISNVTGNWLTTEEATQPRYWAKHLRKTVRFAAGITQLKKLNNAIFLEIGPGRDLSSLVIRHIDDSSEQQVINLLPTPGNEISDLYYLLNKIGLLCLLGVKIDWSGYYAYEKRNRVPLPAYPFESKRYWITENQVKKGGEMVSPGNFSRKKDIADWFYVPQWNRFMLQPGKASDTADESRWLIFVGETGLSLKMVKRFEKKNLDVIEVKMGEAFNRVRDHVYTINPRKAQDYIFLVRELQSINKIPGMVLHFWGVTNPGPADMELKEAGVERAQYSGFYSLVYLAQAIGKQEISNDIQITAVTNNVHSVTGEEILCPEKITGLAPIKIIPQEYPNLTCRSMDIEMPKPGTRQEERLLDQLFEEFMANSSDTVIAFRNNYRFVQHFQPVRLEKRGENITRFREKGVYLITGGLGNIGMQLAESLVKRVKARLVLTSLSTLPNRDEWGKWLSTHPGDNPISRKILKLQALEAMGGEVLALGVDAADEESMIEVITQAEKRFGDINGVIHAAGLTNAASNQVVAEVDEAACQRHFQPKIYGLGVLKNVLKDKELDFCLLISSLAPILGGLGLVAYAAANLFMDAFVYLHNRTNVNWISVNWGDWHFGEVENQSVSQLTMTPEEGIKTFEYILHHYKMDQVIVCPVDLQTRIDKWIKLESVRGSETTHKETLSSLHPRPNLLNPYVAPGNKLEEKITSIWQNLFGMNPIGVRDDFFELGGDSLKAITVIAKIHKVLNVRITLPEFFRQPTIRALARYIKKSLDIDTNPYSPIQPVEEKEYYPLSSAQKRIYIIQQMYIESTGYNMPTFLVLESMFAKEKLAATFKKLIKRHESFRTSFKMIKNEVVQEIHDEVRFKIEYHKAGEKKAKELASDFIKPFDINKAPLLRVGLVTVGTNQHIMMIDMHHIMSDGISWEILIEEFIALYKRENLPQLRIQYKDYSEWLNSDKEKEAIKRQQEYWMKLFEGEIPLLNLPLDYARPDLLSFEGRKFTFTISGEDAKGLKRLALETGATTFIVLLSIFNILLSKVSGQEDIVIGIPVGGRHHSDLYQIVGMFVNTLPMRNYPGDEKTFKYFLKKVKNRTLEAFENQGCLFEDLVDRVVKKKDTNRNPLFDVMFQLEQEGKPKLDVPDLKLKPYQVEYNASKFDLNFTGLETAEHFLFGVGYCTKLFKVETIKVLIKYFQDIISTVISEPGKKLSKLKKISHKDREKLLSQLNEESKNMGSSVEVFQYKVNESLDKYRDNVAIECGNRFITYSQIAENSNRIAGWLIERGAKKNTFIGILANDRTALISAMIGILHAGCVFIPLDPTNPADRLEKMLDIAYVNTIFIDKANYKKYSTAHFFQKKRIQLFLINDLAVETKTPGQFTHNTVQYSSEDKIYVYFTSGTTGIPKAVVGKNKSLLHFCQWEIKTFNLNETVRVGQLAATGFDAFLKEVFVTFLPGGTLCVPINLVAILESEALIDWVEKSQIHLIHCVPALFRLLNSEKLTPNNFPALNYILLSGEKIEPFELKNWYDTFDSRIRIVNLYGTTETTILKTYYLLNKSDVLRERIPIGKPIKGAGVIILDKKMNICDELVTGEIYIKTPFDTFGYYNDPKANKERFISHTFGDAQHTLLYKTGDLGRLLADGNIDLLGRMDRQVKIRGIRIELEEIESVLLRHPAVKEAAVVIKPMSDNKAEVLVAYICKANKSQLDEESSVLDINEYLSEKLPNYMIPADVTIIDKIPKKPNGKIDFNGLPDPLKDSENENEYRRPRTDMQKKVLEIWSEILKTEKIGINMNFFRLGGNSLSVLSLTSKIHKNFDVKIPLSKLFNNPTIEEQAIIIETGAKERYASMEITEKKEFYTLSPAQKRIYVLKQLEKGSTSYNIPQQVVLEGPLDKEKLKKIFRELMKRHESLRTSFEMIEGEPAQRIHDEVEFSVKFFKTGEENKIREISSAFIQPFDLDQSPLLKVGLINIGEERHILMVDIHHIAADGTSVNILLKEFMALYNGEELPALKLQYKDYSQWQNSESQKGIMELRKRYWQKQLEGGIPVLNLPTDYIRPALQSFEGNRLIFEIDSDETKMLRKISLEIDATLFMVLLAVYNILLAKISQQEDIVVGTAVIGRQHNELSNIVGMFVNTLPLRNYPQSEKTFGDFLKEVRNKSMEAFENQDYPFEEMVNLTEINRDASRNPVFDVMFEFIKADTTNISIPGLKLSPFENQKNTAMFDLNFLGIENGETLVFVIGYCTKLFMKEKIEQFVTFFKQIISSIIRNPGQKISGIEIISTAEKRRLLYDFNNTTAVFPGNQTIHHLIEKQSQLTPGKIAVGFNSSELSYLQLNERVNQLAGVLRERGIQKGHLVGIFLNRSPLMVESIAATWKAGGAYIPIDPQEPVKRVIGLLKDAQVKVLITQTGHIDDELQTSYQGQILRPDKQMDEIQQMNTDHQDLPINTHDLAYVIYTSGSTGRPKGAMVEHIGMMNHIWAKIRDLQITGKSIISQNSTHTFDISVWQFFAALTKGGKTVIYPDEIILKPDRFIYRVVDKKVSILEVVPSYLMVMLDFLEMKFEKLDSLHYLIVTGEAIKPTLAGRWFNRYPGIKMVNAYGPTEASDDITHHVMDKIPDVQRIPIGKPVQNMNIYILDKNMNLCPPGITGEICVSGVGVGRGYLNNPELTNSKFEIPNKKTSHQQPHAAMQSCNHASMHHPSPQHPITPLLHSPIYRTGDLGCWLPDGTIEFSGRKDYQVKIRGYRIEMEEIESKLVLYPGIKEAVVTDKEDVHGNKYLCAYYVPHLLNNMLNILELKKFTLQQLPDYMVPAHFFKLEEMPLTSNGKVNRKALPEPEPGTVDMETVYEAPADEMEEMISRVWSEVLGVKNIGINDNFFEVGGDSIKAIQISARLRKYQLKTEIADIFLHQTIKGLKKHIGIIKRQIDQGLVEGEVLLSPVQKWFFDNHFTDSHYYNQAVMIFRETGFQEEIVKKVFTSIVRHHDALRIVYEIEGNVVVQRNRGVEGTFFHLEIIDLRHKTDIAGTIEPGSARIQQGIDLHKGPLLKLGLFKTGKGDHLLIVIHHLVVDGVSWRILLEDFETGCRQLERGEKILFPEKTDSFKHWVEKLKDYSGRTGVLKELTHWKTLEETAIELLPKDNQVPRGQNTFGNTETVYMFLTEEETGKLLKEVHQAYHTEINDILLTALGLAVKDWCGMEKVLVTLEGHGREEIIEEVQISRTIGWFTSQFPVLLDMSPLANEPFDQSTDLSLIIKHVKETLRQIPNRGIGYGILRYLTPGKKKDGVKFCLEPEIAFNYLGQFGEDNGNNNEKAFFSFSKMNMAGSISPEFETTHALEINGMTFNKKLSLSFCYNKFEYNRSTIEKLVACYKLSLEKIVGYCLKKEDSELTLSDFTSSVIGEQELEMIYDELQDEFN